MLTFSKKRRTNKHNKNKTIGCGVCGIDDGKYKCPKCRVPYCSVKCCKEHKLQCTLKITTSSIDSNQTTITESETNQKCKSQYLDANQLTNDPLENASKRRQMLDDDDDSDLELEGWRITKEMMDRIDSSDWIKTELQDGGLRQIIAEIDVADLDQNYPKRKRKLNAQPEPTPRELALMRARQSNPKFSNFIDRLLVTAGVLVQGDLSMEEQVVSFLNGNTEEPLGMLALKPIVKKKRQEPQESMFREIQKNGSDSDKDDDSNGSSGSGSSDDDSSDDDSFTSSSSS